jgi:hypothetical protein
MSKIRYAVIVVMLFTITSPGWSNATSNHRTKASAAQAQGARDVCCWAGLACCVIPPGSR